MKIHKKARTNLFGLEAVCNTAHDKEIKLTRINKEVTCVKCRQQLGLID